MSQKYQDYNYVAFDNKRLRILSLLKARVKYSEAIGFTGLVLALSAVFIFPGLLLILFWLLLFRSQSPGDVFARQNDLKRPFMKSSSNYYFLYKEYSEAMDSALSKTSAAPWGLPVGSGELAIAFFDNMDVMAWGRLSKNFPHLVIDASGNDRFLGNNIDRQELPIEQVTLEGDFPEYFKVYMQKDQEILSLQILTPDRMMSLIDNMPKFDVEIKGNHIKIYGVKIQQNSQSMHLFMKILQSLHEDLKITRLNNIRVG